MNKLVLVSLAACAAVLLVVGGASAEWSCNLFDTQIVYAGVAPGTWSKANDGICHKACKGTKNHRKFHPGYWALRKPDIGLECCCGLTTWDFSRKVVYPDNAHPVLSYQMEDVLGHDENKPLSN